uniref:Uncharacterized protein n=1 Tax=Meloidogyne javanica TaxID=6303 RepID=A0A915MLS1_MELJA
MIEKLCCCGGVEDDDESIERIIQEYRNADANKRLELFRNLTKDKVDKLIALGLFDKTKGPQTRDPAENPPMHAPPPPQNPQDKEKTVVEYVEGKSSSSDDDGVFFKDKDGKIYFRGEGSGQ